MFNFTQKFLAANVKNVSAIEKLEKNSFEPRSAEMPFLTQKSLRIRIPQAFRIVLFLVLSGFFMSANAQRDVLTTQAGEQIRCKILDETPTRFVYAYLRKDGKVLRNEIFKSLVTDFKYNAYSNDLVDSKGRLIPLGEAVTKKDNSSESKETPRNEPAKEDTKVVSNKRLSDSPKTPSNYDGNASGKTNEKANSSKDDLAKPSKSSENSPTKAEVAQADEKKSSGVLLSKKSNDTKKVEPAKTEEKVAAKPAVQATEEKKSSSGLISKKPNDTKKEDSRSSEANKVAKADEKSVAKTTETPKSPSRTQPPARQNVERRPTEKQEDAKAEKPVLENELEKTKDQQKAIAATESPLTAQPTNGVYKNYLKFRVGARGGFASLLTKTPLTDEYSKYKQGIESGWMFGADAAFFPVHNVGIGVMYTNFQSSNDSKSIKYQSIIDQKEVTAPGAVSDKTSTKLLAGVLYYRKNIDYKTFVIFGLAPGMNLYSDKRTEGTTSYAVSGKQFGGAATLGVDFLLGNDIIGRDIILSVEGGYNYAKFDKLNYGNGDVVLSKPQDNSHWSVTIGLRFTRYPKYLRLTSY